MAELSLMGYRSGDTAIHRLDPRLKLAAVAVVSVLSLNAGWPGLVLLTLMIVLGLGAMRLSARALLQDARYLMFLLFLILAARAVFTPGSPLARLGPVVISREGVVDGLLVSWRLACIFGLGAMLVMTTRVASLSAAAAWFLRPVPWVNERRVGTMLGLVVRFVPVIFTQGSVTLDAYRSRGGDRRRNPVTRVSLLVTPMLRRIFLNADRLAIAMAARCYSDTRTEPGFRPGVVDAAAAVFFLVLAAVLLLL